MKPIVIDSRYLLRSSIYVTIIVVFLSSSNGEGVVERTRRGLINQIGGQVSKGIPSVGGLNFTAIGNELRNVKNEAQTLMQQAREVQRQTKLSFESFLETVKAKVKALETSVYPDESNYWSESDSCGGVLISQTGKIAYKPVEVYDAYERCVWTIRANLRSKVKFTLVSSNFEEGHYDFLSVTEIDTGGELPTIKNVQLHKPGKYIFNGPLLLLSFVTDWSGAGSGFILEYEGIGGNVVDGISYRHFYSTDLIGSFPPIPNGILQHTNSNSKEVTTLVISPTYNNATTLHVSGNCSCSEQGKDDLILRLVSLLDESPAFDIGCCRNADTVSSASDEGIMLGLAVGTSSQDYHLEWNTDTEIQSVVSTDVCGGLFSGRRGRIVYKWKRSYENNERCTWVIKSTNEKVKLELRRTGMSDTLDHVSVSTIDINDTITTTRLKQGQFYNFTTPAFLTFYSDEALKGKGFIVDWEDFGKPLQGESTMLKHFVQPSSNESVQVGGSETQYFVINPSHLNGSSISINICFPPVSESVELQLSVYTNDEDTFHLEKRFSLCERLIAVGGIAILVFKPTQVSQEGIVTWDKWTSPHELAEVTEEIQVAEQTEGCGGILIGDSGKIEYKLDTPYESNARCTWIIESKRRLSKMTLKLEKDGFESCCDYIIVTPLNLEDGSLGPSEIIHRAHKAHSFKSPVVFVTFLSDRSLGDGGFRLRFTTSGKVGRFESPPVRFDPRLVRMPSSMSSGTVELNIGEEAAKENETVIVATVFLVEEADTNSTSEPESVTEDPENSDNGLDMETPTVDIKTLRMNISLHGLSVDPFCNKDALSFYDIQTLPSGGPLIPTKTINCSSSEDSCSCSDQREELEVFFKEQYFVSILRKVSNVIISGSFNWTIA